MIARALQAEMDASNPAEDKEQEAADDSELAKRLPA